MSADIWQTFRFPTDSSCVSGAHPVYSGLNWWGNGIKETTMNDYADFEATKKYSIEL